MAKDEARPGMVKLWPGAWMQPSWLFDVAHRTDPNDVVNLYYHYTIRAG